MCGCVGVCVRARARVCSCVGSCVVAAAAVITLRTGFACCTQVLPRVGPAICFFRAAMLRGLPAGFGEFVLAGSWEACRLSTLLPA